MELEVQDRIDQIIQALDITDREFALKTGISPSTLANITGGRRSKPSLEVLQRMKNAYPDISFDWLLMGVGDMWVNFDSHYLNHNKEVNVYKQLKTNNLDSENNIKKVNVHEQKGTDPSIPKFTNQAKETSNESTPSVQSNYRQIKGLEFNVHTGLLKVEYKD